eukprot:CAMPEP_0117593874 /NCGR_PEP_ID=MMETSP0784-20121206/72878_1 /TAXON_ID=39447 /ORGANISM="" /LENGTH=329 /DNA_ID=CAMNT_0005395851 /DNA_START=45 /DNA_END=1031 /DNA_ORIENTATION=+
MSSFREIAAMGCPPPRFFTVDQIEWAVEDDESIIRLQAEGFRAYSSGEVSVPPVQTMGQPPFHSFLGSKDAQTCVKSGYVAGDPYYVIKVAPGGVQDNPSRGLPVNTGLMLIFSQMTARLEAILLDEGLLTEIRTAAACALAASHWAPKELNAIGLVGTGVQARWQLRLLKAVTPCRRVFVHGRSFERAKQFCQEVAAEGWTAAVASAEEVARECRLIHTVTTARVPILRREWVQPGTHITAVGADAPGKQELDVSLVAAADLLICDSHAQTFERGEFQHAAAAGAIDKGQVVEIGVALDRPKLHRTAADQRLTIFDSSGVAVQDVMIA